MKVLRVKDKEDRTVVKEVILETVVSLPALEDELKILKEQKRLRTKVLDIKIKEKKAEIDELNIVLNG